MKSKPFEYIKNYYKVPAEFGRDILSGNRKGTITEDMGNYIGVVFHDDKKKQCYPLHPTSGITYLESFSDLKKFKQTRSAQRYRDYLHADSSLTFKEWLGIR